MYECKYSLYTENDPLNIEQQNPTNVSAVKFEITRETVVDSNLDSSAGDVYCKVWYLSPGSAWELINSNWKLSLSYDSASTSETEILYTNVTMTDALVTKAKILDFFTGSSFVIPVGLNDAQKAQIGVDITNRLSVAYGSAPECVRTPNSLNFTFSNVGSAAYKLNVQYSETDGSLMLYELVSSTDAAHIIFRVEQLLPNTQISPTNGVDGFSIPFLIFSLGLAVVVIIKKKSNTM